MRQRSAMIENIRLRVSVDEKRELEAVARQRGITVSTIVRQALADVVRRAAA